MALNVSHCARFCALQASLTLRLSIHNKNKEKQGEETDWYWNCGRYGA